MYRRIALLGSLTASLTLSLATGLHAQRLRGEADDRLRRPTRPRPAPAPAPAPEPAPAPAPAAQPVATVAKAMTSTSSAARGRYRVTLTGFRVFNETLDNALQLDGKCDEVFISTGVAVLDAKGNNALGTLSPEARSYVFGDVNGQNSLRKPAGGCSPQGGLRAGDQYPVGNLFATPSEGSDPRQLPVVLWDGQLIDGENAVVITPTAWESDNGSQNAAMFTGWLQFYKDRMLRLLAEKELMTLLGPEATLAVKVIDLTLTDGLAFMGQVVGQDGDRPIGVDRTKTSFTFTPKALPLTYRMVENFLTQDHRIAGLPAGVIPVEYVDKGEWAGGSYTLYLKVERR